MEDAAAANKSPSVKRGVPVVMCQNMIKKSLELPKVKFLREQLAKSGCNVDDNLIKAIDCKEKVSGYYSRGKGIMVCSNNVKYQDEVNQVVIHNLIHAYDDCRAANLVWTCARHACSQIRANRLSGDCHFIRELLRGHMKIRGYEQECIKRRTMMAMAGIPHCSEAASKAALEAVWDTCYNDTKPFDKSVNVEIRLRV